MLVGPRTRLTKNRDNLIMSDSETSTYYVVGKLSPEEDCRDFNPGEIQIDDGWVIDIFHAGMSIWKAGESRTFGDVKAIMLDVLETSVICFNLISGLKLKFANQSWLEARGVISKSNTIGWFLSRMDDKWTFNPEAEVNKIWRRIGPFVFPINDSFQHKMALRDYRSCVENPGDDTFFYAYRMLEDVRRAATKKDDEKNWPDMHSILGTTEEELKPLTNVSEKVRHGEVHDPIVIESRKKRKELLKIGIDVMKKEFDRAFPGLLSVSSGDASNLTSIEREVAK